MNQVQHATRRGLLAGLAILPVTAVATPAPDLRAERERLFDAVGDAASEAEADATFERMCAVEQTILSGPVTSRAHAAAKARLICYAMDAGQRSDGLDATSALQLAEWLERS